MDEQSIPLAREIVNLGPTSTGIYVLTTFSQAQIDEMLAEFGAIGWMHDAVNAELTLIRTDPAYRPLATFDLRRGIHRRALSDALKGGTIHICAVESSDRQSRTIEGKKIAIDLAPSDRSMITSALEAKLPGLRS